MSHDMRERMKAEFEDTFKGLEGGVFVDYQGLSAGEVGRFRETLRESDVNLMVVKNSLARRALSALGIADSEEVWKGPTGVLFGGDDPVIAARVLAEWNRKNKKIKMKGAFLEGEMLDKAEAGRLQRLPDRQSLYSMLAGVVVQPVANIATLMNNTIAQVLWAIDAYKEKLEDGEEKVEEKPEDGEEKTPAEE